MAKFDYDLIVIGGGAGGLTASTFAGQSAAKTLLVEKEKKLGGDCLHYGCVPSKSLIKSAYVYNVIRNAEQYGLPPAGITRVDFRKVSERIQNIIGVIQKHDDPDYLFNNFNVETQFGEAGFVDPHTIQLNGKKITSRYFVIATGSAPFIPPIDGLNDTPYITNVNIFSLEKLPQRLIVMGGGPIGTEMAQAFRRLGSQVTILQSGDKFLPKEDPDIADFIKGFLEEEGIEILLNTVAVKAEYENGEFLLTVENKRSAFKQVIRGDQVLVSTGRRPNIKGLDLEKIGVAYTQRGIKVDDRMRTTVPHIYAVGDVAAGYQFTHVASYGAVVAIYNAILKIPKKADYTKTPWCTYLDPEIASIGYNEQRAKQAGIEYIKHVEYITRNDRALAEGENKGLIKILMDKKGHVIGVQLISYHAGDLIGEWIPIINNRLKLTSITEAIHPYPTMGEINKNASVNYLVSTIPPWTKKLTKFLFGYQGKV